MISNKAQPDAVGIWTYIYIDIKHIDTNERYATLKFSLHTISYAMCKLASENKVHVRFSIIWQRICFGLGVFWDQLTDISRLTCVQHEEEEKQRPMGKRNIELLTDSMCVAIEQLINKCICQYLSPWVTLILVIMRFERWSRRTRITSWCKFLKRGRIKDNATVTIFELIGEVHRASLNFIKSKFRKFTTVWLIYDYGFSAKNNNIWMCWNVLSQCNSKYN